MSLGLSTTIELPRIDMNKFEQEFQTSFRQLMELAARAFLLQTVIRIPVRTGFLRGAFTPLENLVGAVQAQGPNRPPQVRRNRRPGARERVLLREYYYYGGQKLLKTTRSGIQFATPEEQIFQLPKVTRTGSTNFVFKFNVDISYFGPNDTKRMRTVPSTPWNSYKEGIAAFVETMKRQFPNYFPTLDKYVIHVRYTCQGETTRTQETVKR